MKFRTARKLNYFKKARHRHGHGIHSPFLFNLITKVIENKERLQVYEVIRDQRYKLSNLIKNNVDSAENKLFSESILNLSGRKNVFKAVELPFRYGKLLVRLIDEFKPQVISYYGSTFGLNLFYLALSNSNIPVNVFQSDILLRRFLQENLKDSGIQNVNFADRDIIDQASFVFINFPFSHGETEKIINSKLLAFSENDIIIVRGIHESKSMESFWREIIKNKSIRISLDLFEIGILFCRMNLQKENFTLRF